MAAFDRLKIRPPVAPMEAKLVDALPTGAGCQFEPKWDGFRCLVFRDGADVSLQSKAERPLERFFPEVVDAVRTIRPKRFVLDAELVIPVNGILSFEALQLRLHPAESRIGKLAAATPARLMLFDALELGGKALVTAPLSERRRRLEAFHGEAAGGDMMLSPCTTDRETAQSWLDLAGGALDGVIVKRSDQPYLPGERAMLKVKHMRTADCVVGGFRYASKEPVVGSLLLGLFDQDGKLNHVGFTSAIPAAERRELTARLEAIIAPPGFDGRAPEGPSRWSTERSGEWEPLKPELVVEVRYDHVTGDRFRHGTKFLRWRPDKAPHQCTMEQLRHEALPAALTPAGRPQA